MRPLVLAEKQLSARAKHQAEIPKPKPEKMKTITQLLSRGAISLLAAHLIGAAQASSHMDAPLIVRDPAANTTDVYAFVQNENGIKSLVTALGVYPHQEPGCGPNKYNFDY